jgi:hypothetical protein
MKRYMYIMDSMTAAELDGKVLHARFICKLLYTLYLSHLNHQITYCMKFIKCMSQYCRSTVACCPLYMISVISMYNVALCSSLLCQHYKPAILTSSCFL